jgi:hypothetical protein
MRPAGCRKGVSRPARRGTLARPRDRLSDERWPGAPGRPSGVAGLDWVGGCGYTACALKMLGVSENILPIDESAELVLSGRVRLLEADPELSARLEGEELDQARKYAMLPAARLDEGRWDIQQLRDARGVRGEVHHSDA